MCATGVVPLALWPFESAAIQTALIVAVVLTGVGVSALAWFKVRADAVRLTHDRFERISLFGIDTRRLQDIIGMRQGSHEFAVLVTREDVRPMMLPRYAFQNPGIADWANSLPFLDLQEALAAEAKLETDPRLGSSLETRRENLGRLRSVARILSYIAIGIVLWAFTFPRPYPLVIGLLVALPVIAMGLALWKRGLFTLVPVERIQVSASLALLVITPSIVLGLRGFLDIQMFDWMQPLTIAVPVTLLVGCLVGVADTNLRNLVMVLFFAPILFAGSWGGLVLGNAILGTEPALLVPVEVIDTGYGDRPSVTIVLPPKYGGRQKTVSVPLATARGADAGESLCMLLHPGRFGWRYVHAVRCTFE